MALFDYKGTGDYFDVRQNLNEVREEQKSRDKALIDNVEKYLQATEEMDKLRGGVETILSQYEVDEKGAPSETAPKYVHDAYKSVNKEGGLARMSKTQLTKVLQGYELGMKEQEFQTKQQFTQAQTRELNAQAAEREMMAPYRLAETIAQTNQREAEAAVLKANAEKAKREMDANDFLSMASEVAPTPERNVTVKRTETGFQTKWRVMVGRDDKGKPVYEEREATLSQDQLDEPFGTTGKTRRDILDSLVGSTPNQNETEDEKRNRIADETQTPGFDRTEDDDVAALFGIDLPDVEPLKDEMEGELQKMAGALGTTVTDLSPLLSRDTNHANYNRAVESLWSLAKNNVNGLGGAGQFIRIKNISGGSTTYTVTDPDGLAKYLATVAARRQAGGDTNLESQLTVRNATFADVFREYKDVRNQRALLVTKAVKQEKEYQYVTNIADTDALIRENYAAAVSAWKSRHPNAPAPVSFSAFAIAATPNFVRHHEVRDPKTGEVTGIQTFVNVGGVNNPKWEMQNDKPASSASETLKERAAQMALANMQFGTPQQPTVYGDIAVAGVVQRAGDPKEIDKFREQADKYTSFMTVAQEIGERWDDMSIRDAFPTEKNKVLRALTAIAMMANREELVGPGVVTLLDREALEKAMKSPDNFESWINSGDNKKALAALGSIMRNNLTAKAMRLGLQVSSAKSVTNAQMRADVNREIGRSSGR
jgi:hypothetical protein